MSLVSADVVRDLVLAHLKEPLTALGYEPAEVPDDFDLLTQGVVDSLGIVQMIAAIDEHFGIEIDFEHLDPEQLTIIGPLCRYIEGWLNEHATRTANGERGR
jgi:acyl carrier protein